MTNSFRFFGWFLLRCRCFGDLAQHALERVNALIRPNLSGGFYKALVLAFGRGFAWRHGRILGDLVVVCEVCHG